MKTINFGKYYKVYGKPYGMGESRIGFDMYFSNKAAAEEIARNAEYYGEQARVQIVNPTILVFDTAQECREHFHRK